MVLESRLGEAPTRLRRKARTPDSLSWRIVKIALYGCCFFPTSMSMPLSLLMVPEKPGKSMRTSSL
jgi:hypothetical protein